MTTPSTHTVPASPRPPAPYEHRIREIGREIFDRARAAEPRIWQSDYWVDVATGLTMKDENLKVRAFRWVDALPAMRDEVDIAAHLREYFDPAQVRLPGIGRLALSFKNPKSLWGRTLGTVAGKVAYSMANRFITGSTPTAAIAAVEALRRRKMAFTLDVLGEATITPAQADRYAQAYIDLIEALGPVAARWPEIPLIDRSGDEPMPRVNVSVKLSSLDTHFDPIDPVGSRKRVSARLRPILRAAQKHGAFVNIDLESFAIRDLTFELFKTLLREPEFRDWPDVGIVVQAYLRDAEDDLRGLLDWVERRGTPIAIRLVKGAYWDHETIASVQNNTPCPVWTNKWESDACFEKLTGIMLAAADRIRPTFGSHNVRSIANAMASAEAAGLGARDYEIQMLHGMGDPLKTAIAGMGRCLRIYSPYGDLIPGMAYLIRRLLENSSNDSFLRQSFRQRRSQERLLSDPAIARPPSTQPATRRYQDTDQESEMSSFRNVPNTSFGRDENRRRMMGAIEQVRGNFEQPIPLTIDGVGVMTEDLIESVNPARPAEIVGRVAQASTAQADKAVAAAGQALPEWRRTPVKRRAQILRRAADLIQEQRFELAATIILEAGKTWREADADVSEGIDYIRYYADRVELLDARPRRRDLPGEDNVTRYEPRGVCAVLGPFNFPLALVANMTAAALATGNTVVLKPSSETPVVAARYVALLERAGLPRGVINFLPGPGATIGAHLVQHPQVHLIAFTGSRAVGLPLIEAAAVVRPGQRHLKRVVADLGGKNATIVDNDAELDEAVLGIQTSAFAYAGQRCSACSRAIVLSGIYDRFCDRLAESTAALTVGPPEHPGTHVGPVISLAALESIHAHIEAARTEGRVLLEGNSKRSGADGYYVGPIVIADVDPRAAIAREEVFGPVLTVIKADDFERALEIANDTPYALTGGVYSRSPAHLEAARTELQVGNLYINRKITGSRVDIQPFGGMKQSGTAAGQAGGPDYLLQFCVARTVTENALRRGFAPTEEHEATPAD
ncbi:MAG: proline dehydrogenase family protein [Planctomycetes bacterium]|nr:proline dehydrogenase family protein [Planctomycetota bacterium]